MSFPDIPECYTCGDSFAEDIDKAQETLSSMINAFTDIGKELPTPTRIEDDDRVYWVPLDTGAVYRIMEMKKGKAKQEIKELNTVF